MTLTIVPYLAGLTMQAKSIMVANSHLADIHSVCLSPFCLSSGYSDNSSLFYFFFNMTGRFLSTLTRYIYFPSFISFLLYCQILVTGNGKWVAWKTSDFINTQDIKRSTRESGSLFLQVGKWVLSIILWISSEARGMGKGECGTEPRVSQNPSGTC